MQNLYCYKAGCAICTKAKLVEHGILNGNAYICEPINFEHKDIPAIMCNNFKCRRARNTDSLCNQCSFNK